MRALQFAEFGGPERLRIATLPDPRPGADQAVVRIMAASVNPSDVKNVAGQMEQTTLPRVPSRDFSGIVEAGPTDWLGAEVWGAGGEIGFTEDGTHAELIAFPSAALNRKPTALNHAEASAIGVNFVIAWLRLMEYGTPTAGETLVVIGIGGGVGVAVAQIAKSKGCRIIGLDRQAPDSASPAAQAIDAFIPSGANVAETVRDLTGGRAAAIVFDTVGGVMFESALGGLGHRGRLTEISSTGRRRVEFDLIDFYHNEGRLMGADSRKLNAVASARIFSQLVQGFEDGYYKAPVIAEMHALAQGPDAYRSVQNATRGTVVFAPQKKIYRQTNDVPMQRAAAMHLHPRFDEPMQWHGHRRLTPQSQLANRKDWPKRSRSLRGDKGRKQPVVDQYVRDKSSGFGERACYGIGDRTVPQTANVVQGGAVTRRGGSRGTVEVRPFHPW